jgi:hypothetical protein
MVVVILLETAPNGYSCEAMGRLSVEANIGWIDVKVTLSHL